MSYIGTVPFSVSLTGVDTTNTVFNWYWNLTGGNTPDFTTQVVNYTYTIPGTYVVSVTGKNSRFTTTATDSVSALPITPIVAIGYSTLSGNIQFPISLTGIDVAGLTPVSNWYWNLTGGNTPDFTTQVVNYTYAQSGTYTITVTGAGTNRNTTAVITVSAYSLENTFKYWYEVRIPSDKYLDIAYDDQSKSVVTVPRAGLSAVRLSRSNNYYYNPILIPLAPPGVTASNWATIVSNNSGSYIAFRQRQSSTASDGNSRLSGARSTDGGLSFLTTPVTAASYGITTGTFFKDTLIVCDLLPIAPDNCLFYSTDFGLTWNRGTTVSIYNDYNSDAFAFNNTDILLSRYSSSGGSPQQFILSANESNFKSSSWSLDFIGGGVYWGSVAYGNGIFAVMNSQGQCARSPLTAANVTSWPAASIGSEAVMHKMCFAGDKFIAIRSDRPTLTGRYSYDGINWNTFNLGFSARPSKLLYRDNRLFIIQGQDSSSITYNTLVIGTNMFEPVTGTAVTPAVTAAQYGSVYVSNFLEYNMSLTVGGFSVKEIGTRNPTLTCIRGQNYDFVLPNLFTYPLSIRNNPGNTASITGNVNDAMFNNNTVSGKSNTRIMFTPLTGMPNSLVYQCTTTPSISGVINII